MAVQYKANPALIFFKVQSGWVIANPILLITQKFKIRDIKVLLEFTDGKEIDHNRFGSQHTLIERFIKEGYLLKSNGSKKANDKSSLIIPDNWQIPDFLFHKFNYSTVIDESVKLIYKKTGNTIKLPKNSTQYISNTLFEKRRSSRNFSPKPLSLTMLSDLLYTVLYSRGKFTKKEYLKFGPKTGEELTVNIGMDKFIFPLGGAINTFSFYVFTGKVKGLQSNKIYKYDFHRHSLSLIGNSSMTDICRFVFYESLWTVDASTVIMIMTTPSLRKHYLHSYKMSLIEAGHILQLFCILAGEMNLAICEMGGINENLIVEYFNAYGKYDTVPVAAIALGEKK